mmetsp:Transcript_76642/g.212186  ORF Transcript_76642/g.212186 Transcript_76642/m.212186 type:complete len:95 (-) Transcript_76642:901-1185(-)
MVSVSERRLVRPIAFVATMGPATMEQVHQRAGQEQQVWPEAGHMTPVFAQQIERGDQRDHQQRDGDWATTRGHAVCMGLIGRVAHERLLAPSDT